MFIYLVLRHAYNENTAICKIRVLIKSAQNLPMKKNNLNIHIFPILV